MNAPDSTKQSKIDSKLEMDTPMMRQYRAIKKDHADAVLFFRMGDFYEMFNEDAKIASAILGIALTSRSKNKANAIPMCGIPHHASALYISKLIQAGKKVALCEQTEDPKSAKGLVKREVVRVITPGTLLDDNLLDPKNHHFIVSLYFDRDSIGLAALDISTGHFKTTQIIGENREALLADELEKIDPREILIPESTLNANGNRKQWLSQGDRYLHSQEDWIFSHGEAHRLLLDHFNTHSLEGFGCEDMPTSVSAAGALIKYLQETQQSALNHVNHLSTYHVHKYMLLDQTTIKSLELVVSSENSRKNSLLDLLDLTCTAMGARRMRDWVLKPLIKKDEIQARLLLVDCFKENPILRGSVREALAHLFDLERLLGRISLGSCNARDLISLKTSAQALPEILDLLRQYDKPILQCHLDGWDNLEDIYEWIDKEIVDDPPFNLKDGNLIKAGCDAELDRLKNISRQGKSYIALLETKERERTGISVLKVGFNKIYGYYIEVTKKHIHQVPEEYIRKQSLVNAERYISPELKEYETEITGAEEKIADLENQLFQQIRQRIAEQGKRIQHVAQKLSEIDTLFAFAEVAHRNNYCLPEILDNTTLVLENGRHPLVEQIDPANQFIPNDAKLDSTENQIMIITGPNMAGKSTYLRQVALISLMAQIGSFVPASRAQVGVIDRIFSRVGAQDHLLKGQSTFMVEMNETANILNNSTPRSLLILDEIGRGTSTFDGISIAWSIVEYLNNHWSDGGPKTLFATHYHELTELELVLTGVKNFNILVREWNEDIVFLRKIAPGVADKSYGIQVARLAGLPDKVLHRAREVLFNLESGELDEVGRPKISHSDQQPSSSAPQQLQMFHEPENPALRKLQELNPDDLTPRQASETLFQLKELLRNDKSVPPKSSKL
jgi:DNA mismatch repair protein MutS